MPEAVRLDFEKLIDYVKDNFSDEGLSVALDVHEFHTAFQRTAKGAADVLAHPAGIYLVKEFLFVVHCKAPLSKLPCTGFACIY